MPNQNDSNPFRSLAQSLADPLFQVDIEGCRILFANDAFKSFFREDYRRETTFDWLSEQLVLPSGESLLSHLAALKYVKGEYIDGPKEVLSLSHSHVADCSLLNGEQLVWQIWLKKSLESPEELSQQNEP